LFLTIHKRCITKFYDPEELKSNEKQKYCWNSSKILSKYVEMEKKIANPDIHILDLFEEGRRTFLVLLYIK
jgi:hypothetical protein